MPAPKRRITAAERDRALRLRRKLTASFGVVGTAAVAALAERGDDLGHQLAQTGHALPEHLEDLGLGYPVALVHEHGVVSTVHRIREHRKLFVREYCHRRVMILATHRGAAFGTSMHVVVTDPDTLGPATKAVEAVVAAMDLACSRFRDDSELSRLQAGEGRHEGIVSPLLAQALATAESAGHGPHLYSHFPDATVSALVGADGVHEWPVAVLALGGGAPALCLRHDSTTASCTKSCASASQSARCRA